MAASKSLIFFLFFAIAALSSVTATDPRRTHLARAHHRHAHHIQAARAPITPIEPASIPVVRKRQSSRRCINRPPPVANGTDSSASLSLSPTSTANVAAAPAVKTKSSSPPPPPPPPSTTTHAASSTPPPPPPKPTTTHVSAPPPPPPPSNPSGPSFLNGPQTGQGTFYEVGGAAVACGENFSDSDFIAAVSHLLFDAFPGNDGNPNHNPVCGRTVTANWQGGSTTVKIVDRCTGCALTDLDFSPSAFGQLTNQNFGLGRISGVVWTWD